MKNQIINYAIKQINSNDMDMTINGELFFKEYAKVFIHNDNFDFSLKNIDFLKVTDLSNKIIKIFTKKISYLSNLDLENNIGLIIFIGNGDIDGNSIILNKSVYIFVDLKAIINRFEINYNLDIFLSHELTHALHYSYNEEFYPKNYVSLEDLYLKRLIAEGIATYMSIYIFKLPKYLSFWVGYLNYYETTLWINYCHKIKSSIRKSLEYSFAHKTLNKTLYNKLFCISSEDFSHCRVGYLYGYEIIADICIHTSLCHTLSLKLNDIKKYISNYFNSDMF